MENVIEVAVIGAGISGLLAAIYLKEAGCLVTVFERSSEPGGVWVYDQRLPIDAGYPASWGGLDEYAVLNGLFTEQLVLTAEELQQLSFVPPGPCYEGLKNNISTRMTSLRVHPWPFSDEDFVDRHFIKAYIDDVASVNNLQSRILCNTLVEKVSKDGSKWQVHTRNLNQSTTNAIPEAEISGFDNIVIAAGHYWDPYVPYVQGLADWKGLWPDKVHHSMAYRRPEQYRGENVLLLGSGVSSSDIARDLGPFAKTIYQVSRGSRYDYPEFVLPENCVRVGEVARFEELPPFLESERKPLQGTVHLKSGHTLRNITRVIVCTGYKLTFPFLPDMHRPDLDASHADEDVLITDGTMAHNLHKDIFYIPDPTLCFIGIPYYVATFTCYEFQAMLVAAVLSGKAKMPSEDVMREEYKARLARKGAGRNFHSLVGDGEEVEYVYEMVAWMNEGRGEDEKVQGHSEEWLEAKRQQLKAQDEKGWRFGSARPLVVDYERLERLQSLAASDES